MTTSDSSSRLWRRWQARVFIGTWLAYVGYYFCRKSLPVVQPVLMDEFGWSKLELGIVATAFQLTYAVGQLVTGILGDRLGARLMLALGLAATILLSALSGFATTITALAIIWALNGFAQATGWPATVRTMAHWFRREQRGRVMGWWSTNYQVGDALGTWIAASAIGLGLGWRWGFWLPALALAALLVPIFWGQRDSPTDVGLGTETAATGANGAMRWSDFTHVLRIPALWGIALVNSSLKFVMYVFFFWVVTYLVEAHAYSTDKAAFLAALVPLGGVVGAVAAGWISDRVFAARRMPVAVIMLCVLTVVVIAVPYAGGNPWALAPLFVLAGFAIYGPESLIAGAAAVELAPKHAAATGVGLVNAIASLSGVPAGIVGATVAQQFGWPAVFFMLGAVSFAALLVAAPMWNVRGRH